MGRKTIGRFTFDNATVQTVPAGGNVQFSNITVSNDCITCDGTNITINKGGLYIIDVNVTSVATAAGNIETQLFRNGNAVPGAHAIDGPAAVGNIITQAFSTPITVDCCSGTTINLRELVATTVRIANIVVIKEA